MENMNFTNNFPYAIISSETNEKEKGEGGN